MRKDLDLRVVSPVEQFGPLPEGSVWPSIYRLLGDLIREHRSTIVFANDRRSVERITAFLNDDEEIARAHHGSVALEVRQQVESALKEGRLPAVVATASLELGIDMGAVDLVCQVASPGNVARGLQRVGRAGHLVGQRSKGRLIPKTPADLLEQAVLAREMTAGRVEAIRTPMNCLDVLAQQVVALAAMDDWTVPDLYALVRRAYPYRDLSPQAFETTLEMVSGRYRFASSARTLEALQPRVSWDRVHNRLLALPGSRHTALVNGGVIPDVGQYAAYTGNGVRIGELDEEFIYERRVGDAFLLGTNAWRLERIEADRVIVSPAEGAPATVPFWRGEGGGRTYDLGLAIGAFLRDLKDRIDAPDLPDWLQRECHLDANAARSLRQHVSRQLVATGSLPTDLTLQVEASRDQLGDWQAVLLSPLGTRLHLSLRMALEARLRQRLGYRPQCVHHNDGVLLRFTDMDEPLLDLFDGLTPENVEELVLDELADSPLFALRFRQNAARALLMPRGQAGRRAPLWLQRMRGRDLLQVCRRHADFPVVAETFRECLHDHLDVPRLQQLLSDIRSGKVEVMARRAEGAVAVRVGSAVLVHRRLHVSVRPHGGGGRPAPVALDKRLLEQLVAPERQAHLLDPRAIHQVERRLRGLGQPPRSATEAAEWLRRLGDLSAVGAGRADGRVPGRTRGRRPRPPARTAALPGAAALGRGGRGDGLSPGLRPRRRRARAGACGRGRDPGALSDDARPGRPGGRAGPLSVRAANGRNGSWRSGRGRDGRGRCGATTPARCGGRRRRTWSRCSAAAWRCCGAKWSPVRRSSSPTSCCAGRASIRRIARAAAEGLADVLDRLAGMFVAGRVVGTDGAARSASPATSRAGWTSGSSAARASGLVAATVPAPECWPSSTAKRRVNCRRPPGSELPPLGDDALAVLEQLYRRGAAFLTDLALEMGLLPGMVRAALWSLVRRGLVTNDQFNVARKGEEASPPAADDKLLACPPCGLAPSGGVVAGRTLVARRLGPAGAGGARRHSGGAAVAALRDRGPRTGAARPVGACRGGCCMRCSAAWNWPARCGAATSWRAFPAPSSRCRKRPGNCKTFVYRPPPRRPVVLLHSQDPANLYGAGAPFDVPLLDGGVRSLLRRSGNWLTLRAGRPVLLIEQQGQRLTALPSASREDVAAAVACLPDLCGRGPTRHKLRVEQWNGRPVTATEGREVLEAAGFVRDYQGMTLYAAWK